MALAPNETPVSITASRYASGCRLLRELVIGERRVRPNEHVVADTQPIPGSGLRPNGGPITNNDVILDDRAAQCVAVAADASPWHDVSERQNACSVTDPLALKTPRGWVNHRCPSGIHALLVAQAGVGRSRWLELLRPRNDCERSTLAILIGTPTSDPTKWGPRRGRLPTGTQGPVLERYKKSGIS